MKRLVSTLLCTFLSLGALAVAQNPPPQSGAATSSNPIAGELGLITLDFPGGTVAQYIDALRKASDDANIVVIGDVTPIQMPSVRLKNVDTWAAVNILNALPQQQKDLRIRIQASISSNEPDQARVYTVSAQTARAGSLGASVESTVISVADVLQGEMTADDLLTAVKIAVDVVGMADEPADIKFHKETGLLIARGSADQVSAIHQVIEQLRDQSQRSYQEEIRRPRTPGPDDRGHALLEAANAIDELRKQVEERNTLIQQILDRLSQLEAQVKQGKQP